MWICDVVQNSNEWHEQRNAVPNEFVLLYVKIIWIIVNSINCIDNISTTYSTRY